jgi:hypothetical protein
LLDIAEGKVHYLIHPDCAKLINDFEKLKWDNGEIGKKDRNLSHPSDAEGYRIHWIRPVRKLVILPGIVGRAAATLPKTTLYRRA